MIFSIHIPKTAGTSFRNALEKRYGERLALYYGLSDPATHPLLKGARGDLASKIPALEAEGIEVLHGHFHLRFVKDAVTDPSRQLWTWLRDPIERLTSHYSFIGERDTKWNFDKEIKSGELSIVEFAMKRRIRNIYSQFLEGFPLRDFAFVGVTERFELGLAPLFGGEAPQLSRRYNAVENRAKVSAKDRAELYSLNGPDLELYAEALRLTIDRVAAAQAIETPKRPEAAGPSIVQRLIRKVS